MRARYRLSLALAVLLLLAACLSASAETRIRNVVYEHWLGTALVMDVFKPDKPNGIGVIWFVSNGWKSSYSAIEIDTAAVFTKRGDTVFEVVHPSVPRFTVQEIVPHIYRAVRYIRTHAAEYGVDPNRLGASGDSAGGHLAMMVGAYGGPGDPDAKDLVDRASSAVEAVGCFYPPTDFLNYGKPGLNPLFDDAYRADWRDFGVDDSTPAAERERIARAMSPFYGLSAHTPPVLILHGDQDPRVPFEQSVKVMQRLQELGVPHKLIVKKGGKHGWPGSTQDCAKVAAWFARWLGK